MLPDINNDLKKKKKSILLIKVKLWNSLNASIRNNDNPRGISTSQSKTINIT